VESPLYVDPDLQAYAAAGLKRGLRSSLNPGVIFRGLRAFREGKRQSATMSAPWQQGGVFIIRPGNRVDFSYISGEAGDHPSAEVILSALDKRVRKKGGHRRCSGARNDEERSRATFR